ncbi:neuronal PAS domain-containing protein 2-like [Notothenia coriiceps]|uniref:Neuronal PAS domain-containing protein 2-like n=1 Tax=Notothenia coriiceps TaxID=8208 RepID=A0A6I9NV00_9TELE|nr:PREDICTED: neuronal PAS domain-containing protein 2-like [Notothenia coriiceps]
MPVQTNPSRGPCPSTATSSMMFLSDQHPLSGRMPTKDKTEAKFNASKEQLRMLLNQPMQTLVPTSSVTTQPSQCNMGISQTIYTLEQQIIAPSFSMQQVNCNAVLVPSPCFTSPIMIPPNGFITNQSQSGYQTQPQASQHSLQLQQPQQFFQMAQGLVHGGSTPAFLHTTNVPQQSTVGYIQQHQTQQLSQAQQQQVQQMQYQHSQTQTSSVSDFRNMLTR